MDSGLTTPWSENPWVPLVRSLVISRLEGDGAKGVVHAVEMQSLLSHFANENDKLTVQAVVSTLTTVAVAMTIDACALQFGADLEGATDPRNLIAKIKSVFVMLDSRPS